MNTDDEPRTTTEQVPVPAEATSWTDLGRRLFEALARAPELKAPPARTTSAYDKVLWLNDLPEHPAIVSAHRLAEPSVEQAVLTLERVPAPAAPQVPERLGPWLEGELDSPD